MKKLPLLIVLALLLFSCVPNEDIIPEEEELTTLTPIANSNIMAEYHVRNPLGNVYAKYYFDDSGKFTKSHILAESFTLNYEYNNIGQLTSIGKLDLDGNILELKRILYDTDGRVTNIGDRTFKYDPQLDIYSEGSSYELVGPYIDGDLMIYDYSYNMYSYFDSFNPVAQYCFYEGSIKTDNVAGGTTDIGDCSSSNFVSYSYLNNNVSQRLYGDLSTNFAFTPTPNPLFNSDTNLVYIFGFLSEEFTNEYYSLIYMLSENNKGFTLWGNDAGPISNTYLYLYNDLGLPVSSATIADHGALFYEYPYANYYYQGDVIPVD